MMMVPRYRQYMWVVNMKYYSSAIVIEQPGNGTGDEGDVSKERGLAGGVDSATNWAAIVGCDGSAHGDAVLIKNEASKSWSLKIGNLSVEVQLTQNTPSFILFSALCTRDTYSFLKKNS